MTAIPPNIDPEFNALLSAACDEQLTEPQWRQLNDLLRRSPEHRAAYLHYLDMHSDIARRGLLGQTAPESPPRAPRRLHHAATWALTASVVLCALLAALLLTPAAPPAHATFARIAHAMDAAWVGDAPPLRSPIGARRITLASGLVRVDFDNGSFVTLQGPAEFELISAQRALLHRGRMTTMVPPEAIGFRLDTPSMTVVDLGTAFGVSVGDDGAAEVCVLEGQIAVSRPGRTGDAPRMLLEGDAARASAAEPGIVNVPFDGAPHAATWPITSGVIGTTGIFRFVEPAPNLLPRTYEDDTHIVVFPERSHAILPHDMAVTLAQPGVAADFTATGGVLPAGTVVRSYLLQFHPSTLTDDDRFRRLRGTVTFDAPVIGLIADARRLRDSDEALGTRNSHFDRGFGGLEGRDRLSLSHDRRSISLDLYTGPGRDQVRVLVAMPAP